MGFDAQWGVLGAHHTGAPHERERIWILAHANGHEEHGGRSALQMGGKPCQTQASKHGFLEGTEWPSKSGIPILADGVAHRMDQLNAIGNGQVPRVAAAAFDLLSR
jgi:DNA (cytosine-5)-methyltransferase 1